jgi:hypothetical protein
MTNLVNKKELTGLNRDTTDKFYTNENIVSLCIENIKVILNINKNDIIIEPSAGNGSFIKYIESLSNNCIYFDILPENKLIKKENYLELNIKSWLKTNNYITNEYLNSTLGISSENLKYKKIHIIGNPPFGRQSSLAIKFIKKSCEFCDTISFILPKSFKKESLKKHFPLNFHLKLELDLPKKSFHFSNENIPYDVPCIFQIWKKEENKREIITKLEPINFVFVKNTENPDISIRRVGGTSGYVDDDINNKNTQSHNFIKFNKNILKKINIKELVKILNNIKYDFNNTVGPKSISKQEIIKEFEIVLKNFN